MRSIRIWRHLVNTAQASGEQSEGVVNGLLSALLNQFKSTSDIKILDEAIEIGEQAVETISQDRDLLQFSNNLCTFYNSRYLGAGRLSDIEKVISIGRENSTSAVDLSMTPALRPTGPSHDAAAIASGSGFDSPKSHPPVVPSTPDITNVTNAVENAPVRITHNLF